MEGREKAAVLPVPVCAMPKNVAPFQRWRNRLLLDRCRRFIFTARDKILDGFRQCEITKFGQVLYLKNMCSPAQNVIVTLRREASR